MLTLYILEFFITENYSGIVVKGKYKKNPSQNSCLTGKKTD